MTHHIHPKLKKVKSFLVLDDAMISFDNLIASKKLFHLSKEINAVNFSPPWAFKRQIVMDFYQLFNLSKNTMATSEQVLDLIKYDDHRPAQLWEGLSQDNNRIKEHKGHLVIFFGKIIELDRTFYVPGIHIDSNRSILSLYGTNRYWKESDLFATVPNKYIYPPLF